MIIDMMTTPTSLCVQVKLEGDDVIIKADKKSLETTRRVKESVSASSNEDNRTFLIIGGGQEREGREGREGGREGEREGKSRAKRV